MRRDATSALPSLASARLRGLARIRPGWYSGAVDDAFTKEELSPLESRIPRNGFVELRCPFCESSELKRVSLVYQEGLAHVKTRSRLLGFVFGEGGIDLVAGRATSRGKQQTELSRILKPPVK